jgi:hypothetical protein
LPAQFDALLHSIQLECGSLLISHGIDGTEHRVCILSSNGKDTQAVLGGEPGSSVDGVNNPSHLAVQYFNKRRFCRRIFVADEYNNRVLVLDASDLSFKGVIDVTQPHRLCYVEEMKLLLVASGQTVEIYKSN